MPDHFSREELREYLGGGVELEPSFASRVEVHVDGCKDCARVLEELKNIQEVPGLSVPAPVSSGSSPALGASGAVRLVPAGLFADRGRANVSRASLREDVPVGRDFGDYELLDVIGRGGIGIVYRARQRGSGLTVALKMLRAGRWPDGEDERRFRLEIAAVGKLDHPAVLPVYHSGIAEGRHFFTMKLIDGPNLESALGEYVGNGREAAMLVATVALAVHHAHENGIRHRDIKPSNILIDGAGRPYIVDFGLAQLAGQEGMSTTGSLLGTPEYMSPEQASGRKGAVTTASDIYGLGAVLYALLTGNPPFRGDSVTELLEAVARRPPRSPRNLRKAVDPDLETICLKCLEKEPGRRYDSARALAEDLERWLEDRPITARRTSATERVRLWCRRNRVVASLLGLLAASLILGSTASVVMVVRAAEDASNARASEQQADSARNAALVARSKATSEAERFRHLAYAADLQLADHVWGAEDGTTREVDSLLRGLIPAGRSPDLRDFTWRYQWTRLHHAVPTFRLPRPAMWGAFTADGRVVTFDQGAALRWWDREGREAARPITFDRTEDARCIGLTADGSMALIRENLSSKVRLHETATGAVLRTVEQPGGLPVLDAAFSSDGKVLMTIAADATARTWEVATGRELESLRLAGLPKTGIFLPSPDGRSVWLGNYPDWFSGGSLDLGTGVFEFSKFYYSTISSAVSARNGLVAFGDSSSQVHFRDVDPNGIPKGVIRLPTGDASKLAFSSSGDSLALGQRDGRVSLWDVARRERIALHKGHLTEICMVASSPDGRWTASGDLDGIVKLWDRTAPEEGARLAFNSRVVDVRYSADGRFLAGISDAETVRVLDARTLITVRFFDRASLGAGIGRCIALSADGRYLAVGMRGDRGVLIVDLESREVRLKFPAEKPDGLPAGMKREVASLDFSPDGRYLAAGYGNRTIFSGPYKEIITIWDLRTRRPVTQLNGHMSHISGIVFSRDGRSMVSGSEDGTVRLWSVDGWRERRVLNAVRGIHSVALAPDDRTIAGGSGDGRIFVWDKGGGEPRIFVGHSLMVAGVTFSPDGRTLASGSSDKSVRLWDVRTGRETLTLRGHHDLVYALAFRPDGGALASGGQDMALRIWPAAPLAEIDAESSAKQPGPASGPVIAARPTASVDLGNLDRFLGEYEFAPGAVAVIARDGAGMRGYFFGHLQWPLAARAETEFALPPSRAMVRFEKYADGDVTALTVHRDGEIMRARRVRRRNEPTDAAPEPRPVVPPELSVLRLYEGIYEYAPGLRLRVSSENGRLTTFGSDLDDYLPGLGRRSWRPVSDSEFVSEDGKSRLTFARDGGGGVSHAVMGLLGIPAKLKRITGETSSSAP